MPVEIKVTLNGLRVLRLFNKNKNRWLAGSEISEVLNLVNGTLYPLLKRFEGAGLLQGKWEKGNPRNLKRPLKRFYRITDLGAKRFLFENSKP